MVLDQNAVQPLYEQLMDAIKKDIMENIYRPGDKLPTETELEKRYQVSRITVRRAVKELCDQKILVKKQGKGTFVLKKEIQAELTGIKGFHDVMEAQRALSQQVLVMREIPATAEVADYLEIQEGTQIAEIHRVLEEGGIPLLLDRCYIPLNRFPDFLTYAKGNFSIYKILRENYHVTMEKAEKVLKVRKANKKECLYLQCKIGEPVFDIFKKVYDEKGVPVHISISILKGENTSYLISTDNVNRLKIKNRMNESQDLILHQ